MSPNEPWYRIGSRIVLYAVCGTSIIALAVDLLLPDDLKFGMLKHASWLTLLLLSGFVLVYLEDRRHKEDHIRAAELGIKHIYRSRTDHGQRENYLHILGRATRELFIVGITLKNISQEPGGILRDRAKEGCMIKLLMLSPEFRANSNPILDPVAAANMIDLTGDFRTAISNIRSIALYINAKNREENRKGRLLVRFYRTAPTVSLTAVDGFTARARMHIEIVPHQISDEEFRPILEITKTGDEEIFSKFYDRYQKLWEESEQYLEVDPDRSPNFSVNQELDDNLCRWLDLPKHWRAGEGNHSKTTSSGL